MSLDADLLAAIDARIAAAITRTAANGTVASISGDNDALVTFDGSTLAIPVKLAGTVFALEGDRVLLVKAGLWWTVVATFPRRWPSSNGASVLQSAGTTTSSSMADMPTNCAFAFTKRWDATRVKVWMQSDSFTDVRSTRPTFGAQFVSSTTTLQVDVSTVQVDAIATQRTATDQQYVSGLPAGVYAVTAQWRRNSGTGTMSVDAGCRTALSCEEVSPT